jgi:hypothetical protein
MNAAGVTLLDEVLPEYDVAARHSRHIAAPAEWVAQAVDIVRPGPAASFLYRARGIRVPRGSFRDMLVNLGFTILAERKETEFVAGTIGQFWALRESAHIERPRDLEAFRAFDRPGWAKGAVSLRIDPLDAESTRLVTETRVQTLGRTARRRFGMYWFFVRPFSGWLRRDFLRRVARVAEGES